MVHKARRGKKAVSLSRPSAHHLIVGDYYAADLSPYKSSDVYRVHGHTKQGVPLVKPISLRKEHTGEIRNTFGVIMSHQWTASILDGKELPDIIRCRTGYRKRKCIVSTDADSPSELPASDARPCSLPPEVWVIIMRRVKDSFRTPKWYRSHKEWEVRSRDIINIRAVSKLHRELFDSVIGVRAPPWRVFHGSDYPGCGGYLKRVDPTMPLTYSIDMGD